MKIYTLQDIYKAAKYWYNSYDRGSLCLAENRLMRGKTIEDDK